MIVSRPSRSPPRGLVRVTIAFCVVRARCDPPPQVSWSSFYARARAHCVLKSLETGSEEQAGSLVPRHPAHGPLQKVPLCLRHKHSGLHTGRLWLICDWLKTHPNMATVPTGHLRLPKYRSTDLGNHGINLLVSTSTIFRGLVQSSKRMDDLAIYKSAVIRVQAVGLPSYFCRSP